MVTIQQVHKEEKRSIKLYVVLSLACVLLIYHWTAVGKQHDANPNPSSKTLRRGPEASAEISPQAVVAKPISENTPMEKKPEEVRVIDKEEEPSCPYTSLSQLTKEERYPSQGSRHMVTPPAGGTVALVCCRTTKGPWNIAVHSKWAPIGAERFLDMVKSGYFSSKIPLFRCIEGFLCQFGLSGNPKATKRFDGGLSDDTQWLPQGPGFRQVKGVKRFALGYMAYAGSGPNSRSNQLFVSLKASGPLAGGAPWEVPWGELVGAHSYETLENIYTGYGEHGPSQGLLRRHGVSSETAAKFPLMDYITSCNIVDQEEQG